MLIFLLKSFSIFFTIYMGLVATNLAILWLDNQVKLSNQQVGYQSFESLVKRAFLNTHIQLAKLKFWSRKGAEKLIEHQNKQLQLERYNIALNGIVNELTYNFESSTNLKLTNKVWFNGWYLYIPITKEISLNLLSEVESYLLGVASKYTQEFSPDSLTCQNLQNIGWCLVLQLNYDQTAKFNRLARQQEIANPNDFDEEDEVF
ncbi:hypothetical protein [Streptococcus orisratti]|uniref:hypothetical protein n=1 Tax=Streptococcus orisratti TaxID=114652 RepID=UPI003D0894D4|nr:hypothetical protein [Streptococcus sp.]